MQHTVAVVTDEALLQAAGVDGAEDGGGAAAVESCVGTVERWRESGSNYSPEKHEHFYIFKLIQTIERRKHKDHTYSCQKYYS